MTTTPQQTPKWVASARLCPSCGGALEVQQRTEATNLKCTTCEWWASVPTGWRFPAEFNMGSCDRGHQGAWVYKRAGRVVSWMCSFVIRTGDKISRCALLRREGELQGFLDPNKPCAAPYETRDGVVSALYLAGPNGEPIPDLLLRAPDLNEGRLTSSLTKMLGTKWPFVERSDQREPRIKAGSAYRWWLSLRGVAYCYLLWPELQTRDDVWKNPGG